MSKDNRLPEQYCSTGLPKAAGESDSDVQSWTQIGVNTAAGESDSDVQSWTQIGVNTKSYQVSSSGDNKSLYDSGRTDSGFLSSANILSDQFLSEEISAPPSPQKSKELDCGESDTKSFMRLDSGVDVGLDDKFSGLSLKESPYNDLNSGGSKSLSITSCTNISDVNIKPESLTSIDTGITDLKKPVAFPWEVYFQQDEDGDTQLHIAILHCFIEVVYSLIRMVPQPQYLDIHNDFYQTPLHLAVLTSQPRIVRQLLSEGASPDILDNNGNTALHLASSMGDVDCVYALTDPIASKDVGHGNELRQATFVRSTAPVYINRYNYDGLTCLHLAALGGHIDVMQCLLFYGADVNARECKSGLTALHIAIELNNEGMMHFLLNNCREVIDLEKTTYAGITAFQMASRIRSQFANLLLQSGAKWYQDDSTDEDSDFEDEEEEEIHNNNLVHIAA